MLKFLLILGIAFLGMFDYHVFAFYNGSFHTSFTSTKPDEDLVSSISLLVSVEEIVYYDNPFGEDYVLVIHSNDYGLLFYQATDNDLSALSIMGLLQRELAPNKKTPVSPFIYGGGILLILIIPFKKKKAKYQRT